MQSCVEGGGKRCKKIYKRHAGQRPGERQKGCALAANSTGPPKSVPVATSMSVVALTKPAVGLWAGWDEPGFTAVSQLPFLWEVPHPAIYANASLGAQIAEGGSDLTPPPPACPTKNCGPNWGVRGEGCIVRLCVVGHEMKG